MTKEERKVKVEAGARDFAVRFEGVMCDLAGVDDFELKRPDIEILSEPCDSCSA